MQVASLELYVKFWQSYATKPLALQWTKLLRFSKNPSFSLTETGEQIDHKIKQKLNRLRSCCSE